MRNASRACVGSQCRSCCYDANTAHLPSWKMRNRIFCTRQQLQTIVLLTALLVVGADAYDVNINSCSPHRPRIAATFTHRNHFGGSRTILRVCNSISARNLRLPHLIVLVVPDAAHQIGQVLVEHPLEVPLHLLQCHDGLVVSGSGGRV